MTPKSLNPSMTLTSPVCRAMGYILARIMDAIHTESALQSIRGRNRKKKNIKGIIYGMGSATNS